MRKVGPCVYEFDSQGEVRLAWTTIIGESRRQAIIAHVMRQKMAALPQGEEHDLARNLFRSNAKFADGMAAQLLPLAEVLGGPSSLGGWATKLGDPAMLVGQRASKPDVELALELADAYCKAA